MEEQTNKVLGLDAIPAIKSNVDAAIKVETDARTAAIESVETAIDNEKTARETADTTLDGKIATNAQEIAAVDALIKSTQGNLTTEVTNRETADNNLQSQIDALLSKTDVVDIVGDYEQLQAYDTSKLANRDVIEVLNDVNHNGAVSYYRWNEPTAGEWNWIGSIASYYTKSESNSLFVPMTRTINGQSLAQDVIIELPTKTSDLTNDSGFITSSALTPYVPKTTTINNKALSSDITLKTSDLENDSGFVTGTGLKTINGTSIVGSGNTYIRNGQYSAYLPDPSSTFINLTSSSDTSKPLIDYSTVNQSNVRSFLNVLRVWFVLPAQFSGGCVEYIITINGTTHYSSLYLPPNPRSNNLTYQYVNVLPVQIPPLSSVQMIMWKLDISDDELIKVQVGQGSTQIFTYPIVNSFSA